VAVALLDKLCANNVLSIIASDDVGKHDLAADCQQWQVGLWGLRKVFHANDMLSPFLVPRVFGVKDVTLLKGPFTNILDNFLQISIKVDMLWQQYLREHDTDVDLESVTWAVEIIDKSMTPELKTLVYNDIENLSKTEIGAVTT